MAEFQNCPLSPNFGRRALVTGLALALCVMPVLAQPATPAPPPPPADKFQAKPDDFKPDVPAASAQEMQLVAHPALYLHGKGRWDGGLQAIQALTARLKSAADAAGLAIASPPQMVFLATSDDGYTYNAMLPLTAPVPAGTKLPEGFLTGETPAGKAVRFSHDGAYQDIDDTYEVLTAWLDDRGLDTRNMFIEEYLNTAKDNADPSLKVHIYVLLK
ncbi:MAG: GyrI-like domain-containing protein [Hyphomicrobiales bacterium]|nr:GyrI-like domain-containing protein [Hyphomicrobiales bacterium]